MSQETQPIKQKNTSAWMTALKEYNQGKQWCVPKKDTPEYLAVKEIADKIKATKKETGPTSVPTIISTPTNPNGSNEVQFKSAKKTRKKKVEPTV